MNSVIKNIFRPFYNAAYFFTQRTLSINPFIPKKITGKKISYGHLRYEQENDPSLDEKIEAELKKKKIAVAEYFIDIPAFRKYLTDAPYPQNYYGDSKGRKDDFTEKTLEHFVSLQLLELRYGQTVIDVGAGDSPFCAVSERIIPGIKCFSLDTHFPPAGKRKIRASASQIPFENESVDALVLHCAFEHFEGNADIDFLAEAQRVLKKGGKCLILPFYLSSRYAIHIDPMNNFLKRLQPEMNEGEASILYCDSRQSFTRHYDVPAFRKRILCNLKNVDVMVHRVKNFKEVNTDCYLRFILSLTKQ